MLEMEKHYFYMQMALREAKVAAEKGEVPVGAIIVSADQVVAKTHNLTEQLTDVTAHAEMQAITAASHHLGSKYLNHCILYVTLEPCSMCAGALYWSQIGEVNFAAADPKHGFKANGGQLHPKTTLNEGMLADEAKNIIQTFFQSKRN